MTFRPVLQTVVLLGSLALFQNICPPDAHAQGIINRAKLATVLVDRGALGSGSGFCVSTKGLFVTNAHVVQGVPPGKSVRIVISPSTADERTLNARLLSVDEELDLALLQSEDAQKLTALQVGGAQNLTETQSLTVLGYPFGRLLAYGGGYPSISVNVSRVSALRREEGELRAVQLDGAVNPGNSGGPVINENGQVVAVVVSAIPGSGVSFSIPSTSVEKFLGKPAVVMQLPEVQYVDRRKPIEFGFESIAFDSSVQPNAFQLTLDAGDGDGRPIKLTLADMKRKKKVKLIEAGGDVPEAVLLMVRRGSETVYVPTTNHDVQVGTKTFSLLELRRIEGRPEGSVVMTAAGTKYLGALSGWTDDETSKSRGLLSAADRIDVYSLDPLQREVRCTLVAMRAGKEVARVEELLKFSGAPQVLKKDIIERFLETISPGTAEDPLAELRAKVEVSRDTAETVERWESRRASGVSQWTVAEATSVRAEDVRDAAELQFEKQEDGSWFVSGPEVTATYVLECRPPFPIENLSGVKIEMLPDPRLPSSRLGRNDEGRAIITSFQAAMIQGSGSVPLRPARVTVDFFQTVNRPNGWPPTNMLDTDRKTGWAVFPEWDQRHEAVFEIEPVDSPAGGPPMIQVRIGCHHSHEHLVGRFRVSLTDAPRPVVVDELPDAIAEIVKCAANDRTAAQQDALLKFFTDSNLLASAAEQELATAIADRAAGTQVSSQRKQLEKARETPEMIADWEARRRQGLPQWTVLEATSLTAAKNEKSAEYTFERMPDGSYFVTGPQVQVEYIFRARTPFPVSKVTAIRLETVLDDRLPDGGAGRASNGNCVISALRAMANNRGGPSALTAARVTADHFQWETYGDPYAPTRMFDADNRTGWAIGRDTEHPHQAVIEVVCPAELEPTLTEIEIHIEQLYDDAHSLGRFRLSVTDAPRPLVVDQLPKPIDEIVNTASDRRTSAQHAELLKFFTDSNLLVPKLERELAEAASTNMFPLEAFVDRTDPYAALLDSFEIEAEIESSSSLWVTRYGLMWQHHRGQKPGTVTPSGKVVKVNGAPWYLSWINNSGAVEGEDQTRLYRLPLGPGIWDFEVLSAVNAETGQPDPGRYAIDQDIMDDHTEMDLDDNADGAGLYRIRFTRRK